MGSLSSKNSIEDDYSNLNIEDDYNSLNIEDDYNSLNELLAAAKVGKWAKVWEVLGTPDKPRKAYLLNSIPAERRWSVLHQAVYWRNKEVIEILLKFDTCDTGVKAKEGTCEVGPAGGKTPRDVAEQFKYSEIVTLLEGHTCNLWSQEMPTFHSQNHTMNNDGFGLFCITMAAYKDVFHPSAISKPWSDQGLMQDVFNYINSNDNWKFVRDKVSQPLFPVSKSVTSNLDLCENKDDFFKKIINLYSWEESRLYTFLNTALRRQKRQDYMPTADDLAIGPYIMVLNLLLMYWNGVNAETRTTYRRMVLTEADSRMYRRGVSFMWISIVSSSVQKGKAESFPTCGPTGDTHITFVIDNTTESLWRPRNIEEFSRYNEAERVYPAGSRFRVIRRDTVGEITEVRLKLLGKSFPDGVVS